MSSGRGTGHDRRAWPHEVETDRPLLYIGIADGRVHGARARVRGTQNGESAPTHAAHAREPPRPPHTLGDMLVMTNIVITNMSPTHAAHAREPPRPPRPPSRIHALSLKMTAPARASKRTHGMP